VDDEGFGQEDLVFWDCLYLGIVIAIILILLGIVTI